MYIVRQKQTHRYGKLTSGYQWGEGNGEGQDRHMGLRGINDYVISNKDRLYSTGNYSHYLVMTFNGV